MPTYDLIASSNVTSAVNNVTFSSIPATYDDLVLHVSSLYQTNDGSPNNSSYFIQMNGDTSSAYTFRILRATGSPIAVSGQSYGTGTTGEVTAAGDGISLSYGASGTFTIFQYTNTSAYKQVMTHFGNSPGGQAVDMVGNYVWANTSAINSIKFYPQRNSFVSGTRIYLYGIKGA
jgi:hypothetical protein